METEKRYLLALGCFCISVDLFKENRKIINIEIYNKNNKG